MIKKNIFGSAFIAHKYFTIMKVMLKCLKEKQIKSKNKDLINFLPTHFLNSDTFNMESEKSKNC